MLIDLDRDGVEDLLELDDTSSPWTITLRYRDPSAGTFAFRRETTLAVPRHSGGWSTFEGSLLGDVDGDGHQDLVAIALEPPAVYRGTRMGS